MTIEFKTISDYELLRMARRFFHISEYPVGRSKADHKSRSEDRERRRRKSMKNRYEWRKVNSLYCWVLYDTISRNEIIRTTQFGYEVYKKLGIS